MTRCLGLALACATVAFAFTQSPARAADVMIEEGGSTLLYPLFQAWAAGYKTIAPNVQITTAATGSGAGVAAAINGSVRIGTSDAYMSDAVAAQNPEMLNIPLAISAQTINYNLPGLNGANIKIDGPTLAAIYSGKTTEWDDPAIKAMNPGVDLPHHGIVPVRRADGSGDTFIFSQFLDFSAESWEDNPGYGTEIRWPLVSAEKTATGNGGMVSTLGATPYSIGYVGISYAGQIAKTALGTAMVRNQADKFLLPSARTIADAAAQLDPRTPPYQRISLVYAPGGNSYPLINYEYAVVSKTQPSAATADAVRSFLLWAIAESGGNGSTYLTPVGFIPLPDFIRGQSEAQIGQIR